MRISGPDPASAPAALPGAGAAAFLAWAGVGVCVSAGLLGALSIGPFAVLIAIAGVAALIWRRALGISCWGLLAGAGLLPIFVAYLNRDGPGQICTTTSTGSGCVTEWSPWPWLAAGLALTAAGTGAFLVLRRRAARMRRG